MSDLEASIYFYSDFKQIILLLKCVHFNQELVRRSTDSSELKGQVSFFLLSELREISIKAGEGPNSRCNIKFAPYAL